MPLVLGESAGRAAVALRRAETPMCNAGTKPRRSGGGGGSWAPGAARRLAAAACAQPRPMARVGVLWAVPARSTGASERGGLRGVSSGVWAALIIARPVISSGWRPVPRRLLPSACGHRRVGIGWACWRRGGALARPHACNIWAAFCGHVAGPGVRCEVGRGAMLLLLPDTATPPPLWRGCGAPAGVAAADAGHGAGPVPLA